MLADKCVCDSSKCQWHARARPSFIQFMATCHVLLFRSADGRRKRNLIDDNSESAAGAFSSILGGSPSKLMRFHDALLYRRRLAEYYANCSPSFPLLPLQLRRPIQSYDPKLFPPAVRPGSPPIADGNASGGSLTVGVSGSSAASQSSTSVLSRGGDQVGTEQPVSPPSMPLFGALFSYLHPSLTAAAAAAMAHWYLGAGAAGGGAATRPSPAADPAVLTQRGAGQVPDWVVRLRVEDLLRARSAAAAAAAMTSQTSSSASSGQYVGVDDGSWVRHAATRVTEAVPSQQPPPHRMSASPGTAASSDVTFRPYLPDVRRPTLSGEQRPSPDAEPALTAVHWDRSEAVSCGSKTPDQETGSGDSVSGGGGGGVEASDGRNSSELVNMERMVHGLKHVQSAAIEELSKVADSY